VTSLDEYPHPRIYKDRAVCLRVLERWTGTATLSELIYHVQTVFEDGGLGRDLADVQAGKMI
jgi:ubiquitin-protein ligase